MKIKIYSIFYIFFLLVSIYFIVIPAYVLFTPEIQLAYYFPRVDDSFNKASVLMIINTLTFLFIFTIFYLLFYKAFKLNSVREISLIEVKSFNKFNQLTTIKLGMIVYASFGILFYFFYKGLDKISLLGSGTDAWEYRMIGFDDTPTLIKLLLESSRRIILPYLLITQLIQVKLNKTFQLKKRNDYYLLYYLLLLYIVSIVSTLDRAPLMTLIILFAYVTFFLNYSINKLIYGVSIFILFIIFFGAITTFAQYNKTDFSSTDIFFTGINFIFQRVLIDPSLTAIQIVYETFDFGSDKLLFKFSRLGFLFGQEYVGTETDNSLFVAPVGFIADTWRNAGFVGIAIVSVILSFIVAFADIKLKQIGVLKSFVLIYLFISTVMFLIYGVLFSMGAFSQILFFIYMIHYMRKTNNIKL